MPWGRPLVSLSIPMICAQLVTLLYNVVDRMFIGKMENGSMAMAGIGVAGMLVMILAGFSQLFGASEEVLPYAMDYCGVYCLGIIFVEITLGMNAFINTQGFARTGMATVLSQGVSGVWVLAEPVSDFLTTCTNSVVFRRFVKKKVPKPA